MKMEGLSKKESDEDKSDIFELPPEIGRYKIIRKNAYDVARKLSLALPVVATVLGSVNPERAHAVEIPQHATYEQGIALLAKATQTENYETGAMFVQFPNGETRWYSVEGDEDSIDPREMLDRFAQIVDSGSLDYPFKGRDRLNVIILHNHPQYSAEVVGLVESDGPLASYPPSGAGIADGVADTGYYGHQEIEKHIAQVELKHGVNIDSFQQVIDPLGVWTYKLDLDEAEKAGDELLSYRTKKDIQKATHETERMRLQSEFDEVHEQIANFEYPSEWHDLRERNSELNFAQYVFKKTGEVIEEDYAIKHTEVLKKLRRIESEVGLDELKKGGMIFVLS